MESAPAYRRLLLTGAAGGLGRVLRPAMREWAAKLRVSDIAPLGPAAANEEVVPCDLGDGHAVRTLLEGVDGVVHLGGISTEHPWPPILADVHILGV